MLYEELILELESILDEADYDSERTKRMLDIRAKRFQKIRNKYPMGTRYIHSSGADITKGGKAAFPTVSMQKKYEKEKMKASTKVSPTEKSALSTALKRIQKSRAAAKQPGKAQVIPFRARKAA